MRAHAVATSLSPAGRLLLGFVAGFLAVPVFHQVMVLVLHELGLIGGWPYQMSPVPPFGVPKVIDASFWGGVWGLVFTYVERLFPRGAAYWVVSFLFGGIVLTLVAWLVVMPLKGMPFAGFEPGRLVIGLLVNGAWGVGAAVFFRIGLRLLANDAPRS
jgi:hypothetical protein